jgi:hypothetical protein
LLLCIGAVNSAFAATSVLRARTARKSNSQFGLKADIPKKAPLESGAFP